MTTYAARWVFPVDGPPLERGSVTVAGDRIASVNPAGERTVDFDLGHVALLPGFVNAHTHLDLTGALGRCPPTPDFTAWLRQVIAYRRERTPAQVQEDIAAGMDACVRSGTTLVGDIASGGANWDLLVRRPLRATAYYELIGLTQPRAGQVLREAMLWLQAHPATPTCLPGLSPHAPYSVRSELYCAVSDVARTWKTPLPVATHLAETPEEIEFLQHRRGPFVDLLRELGAWDPNGLIASVDEVARLLRGRQHVSFIHGNHLPADFAADDSTLLDPWSSSGAWHTVVSCPRTTAAFGRPALRRAGSRCAFGTDSLASNLDLDVLAEARLVYRQMLAERARDPRVAVLILHSLTYEGALALGWVNETGSLKEGKSADLVVLPVPPRSNVKVPHDLIFDSDLPVAAVMFRGEWVVGEPRR